MPRLAALLSAAFLLLAAPALAAPVTFDLDEENSSLQFGCTAPLQNGSCNLDEVDFEFEDGDRVGLGQSFPFLEFEAKGTEELGDSFFVIATLAFKVTGLPTPYTVTATGTGSFTATWGYFRSFSIDWSPLASIITTGLGTFSVAFEDLDLRGLDDEDDDEVYVNARISAVPLPAGAVLLLSGLALIGAARLRRRA